MKAPPSGGITLGESDGGGIATIFLGTEFTFSFSCCKGSLNFWTHTNGKKHINNLDARKEEEIGRTAERLKLITNVE